MRLIIVYSILLAFVLQLGNRLYVLVNFQINKEYIAENLCEKKDEPESCCEGSCHLAKELVKIEKEKEQTPSKPSESKKEKSGEFNMFSKELGVLDRVNSFMGIIGHDQNDQTLNGFLKLPFHPPSI